MKQIAKKVRSPSGSKSKRKSGDGLPRRKKKAQKKSIGKPAGRAKKKHRSTASGTPSETSPSIPIVGVGASAGGLEAFTELLSHLPVDTGMGFVLVQHLDPHHESALVQLLARATTMPVREITDGQRVGPNCIHVIPINKLVSIAGGALQLKPRVAGRTPARSIDFFLESLAHDQRDRSIGVILSGTATDGTLGLEAIKSEGGITFAQDASAKYDSMPRSAVVAGCVDFELSPEKIARELARIAAHPFVKGDVSREAAGEEGDGVQAIEHEDDDTPLPSGGHGKPKGDPLPPAAEAGHDGPAGRDGNAIRKILLLVRNHTGVDFSLYKSATILRRISRRMVLNQLENHAAYAGFLRGNAAELDALFSDMLISVTSFFRNPEAFDLLQRKVFPKFLAQRSAAPVRIWVLGCSTGQEAYSLAMAFLESAGNSARARKLQVFATDLNDSLLEKARSGLYAKSLAQDISPERLRRFFVQEEGGYRATKELRQCVVFARQNVLSDPPFSRMDLVSCRNLLIYFDQGWQKKILPMFHYALNPEGILFLGASESVAGFTELFEPMDKKHKMFGKRGGHAPTPSLPVHGRGKETMRALPVPRSRVAAPETLGVELNAQREADRHTINQFAPPGVLINDALQILQFRGSTDAFLEPPLGSASFDLLKMAREGLMLPLRAAINRAKKDGRPVRKEHVSVRHKSGTRLVTLQVTPLKNLKERCFLILFENERGDAAASVSDGSSSRNRRPDRGDGERTLSKREESRRIRELETELAETRDYLQGLQEQQEAAGEELQASNEEVTSANEELQSINEELETSKEELESANEELITVNEEMANRNNELNRLYADLSNLHVSINTAILVLGRDLTIRRFTAPAEKIFHLLAGDLGRPLGVIRHHLEISAPDASSGPAAADKDHGVTLEDLVREVIDTVSVRTRSVRDRDGHWYTLRVRPYLTLKKKIDGAVLVLEDVDLLKRSEQDARLARSYAEAILRTIPTPLIVLRPDLRVNTANAVFYKTFRLSPSETEGHLLWELGQGEWNIPRLRALLTDILPGSRSFDEYEITQDFPGVGRRTLMLNARRLDGKESPSEMILLAIEDVTDRLRLVDSVRLSEERFRVLTEATSQIVWTADADGRVSQDSPSWRAFTGQTVEQWQGLGGLDVVHPDDRARVEKTWLECVATRDSYEIEYRLRRADGIYRWTASRGVPVMELDGSVREWIGTNTDITERKDATDVAARLAAIVESSADAMLSNSLDGIITDWNESAERLFGYTAGEAIGRNISMLNSPEGGEAETKRLVACIRRGERVEPFDTVRRCKDGSLLEISLSVSPLRDAAGKIVGASKIARDITESRQIAVELARARDEAVEASRAKDEFLATLSHELRTPLNPVLLLASDAAANDELPDEVRADFETIRKNISLEARLIDDLLDLTRISRGSLKIEPRPCDAHAVLRDALAVVQSDLDEKRIELSLDLRAKHIDVMGDPVRLEQIFWNVLRNAVHFTPGKGKIAVSSHVTPPGDELVVTIADSGIGIGPKDLTRIFEAFAQGDAVPGAPRRSGGLGLGLAISRKLVELHAGSIAVSSPGRGGGSTFTITLPLIPVSGGAQRAAGDDMRSGPRPTRSKEPFANRGSILIVDDHVPTIAAMRRIIKRWNFEVHTAGSIAEALKVADQHMIEFVISDIGLPDGDGYSLMVQLQAVRPALVGIALSGYGAENDLVKAREAGFAAHLTKPVKMEDLEKALRNLGDRKPS